MPFSCASMGTRRFALSMGISQACYVRWLGHEDASADCTCPVPADAFDVIAAHELRRPPSLAEVVLAAPLFMFSTEQSEHGVPPQLHSGVYLLWNRIDYCEVHHHQINEALYVGKGDVAVRLRRHYQTKAFPEEIVFVTHLDLPNRLAKYVEQLLLDLYDMPMNTHENLGRSHLRNCWDDNLLD